MSERRSVAVVGTGSVGVAAAHAIFMQRTASELLLVDKDRAKAEGHAMDLMHGQALVGRVDVRAASFPDLSDAGVIVVTAGRNQKKGESRLDLLRGNAAVVREVIAELDRFAPDAIVVLATNPVDVLTKVAAEVSRRDPCRVLGTGTTLDSARFRALISAAFGVSPRSVHAQILGEHGDSQVPIWSQATIGGTHVVLDGAERARIADATRTAAREIIERKGYTDLAIGTVIAHLVECVLDDQRAVLPLSVVLDGEYGLRDVCLSIPCVLGRTGIVRRITPVLETNELDALRASAEVLRAAEGALLAAEGGDRRR